MILEGVRLMFVGMFTVFAILTLLVGLMQASSAFFEANAHRFPEPKPDSPGKNAVKSKSDDEIALAIALASAMRRGQRV